MSPAPAAPAGRFGTGWSPARAVKARAALLATNRYARVRDEAKPTKAAFSLTQYRPRDMIQYAAGMCYSHSAVAVGEWTAKVRGYEGFPVSRWLIGYATKDLFERNPDGSLDNPSNGGSITDALRAMTEPIGVGMAHEALAPYPESFDPDFESNYLIRKPPQQAYDDAKECHLVLPVPVETKDALMVLVENGHPVGLGIWWSDAWDGPATFHADQAPGEMGHALLVTGFARPGVFDDNGWWQLTHWHDLRYPPLPPDKAAKVEGYVPSTPSRTSDFWMSDRLLDWAIAQGGACEVVSAADWSEASQKILVPSAVGMFPVM